MNLLTFKEQGPISGIDDKYKTGIIGRRWALVAKRKFIGLEQQVLFYNSDIWVEGGRYYVTGLRKRPKFGYFNTWHDGNHSVIYFGWFFISWGY